MLELGVDVLKDVVATLEEAAAEANSPAAKKITRRWYNLLERGVNILWINIQQQAFDHNDRVKRIKATKKPIPSYQQDASNPRTPGVPSRVCYQKQTKLHGFLQLFNHISLLMSRRYVCVSDEEYVLDQWEAFSHGYRYSSVSISRFKVQSSIGHLVWFFDSGNSIVSGANLWCPCVDCFKKSKKFKDFRLGLLLLKRWEMFLIHLISEGWVAPLKMKDQALPALDRATKDHGKNLTGKIAYTLNFQEKFPI